MERELSEGSSNIASVGYDDDAGEMEVEFRGGSVYRYTCSREIFEEWKDAGFRGQHFHRHVKLLFEGVKQPREQDKIEG